MWHVNRNIAPNEKTKPDDKKPVGDFHYHNGKWILINRRLPDMRDVTEAIPRKIGIGEYVELTEGRKILLNGEEGGRLIVVQIVNG